MTSRRSPCRCRPAGRSRRCAGRPGATLIWTKVSTPHLMETAVDAGRRLRLQPGGGLHLPVVPARLRRRGHPRQRARPAGQGRAGRSSEVVAALPRIHIAHESVVTPWEQKGLVMRTIVEQAKDRETVLVDGVKVLHDDGWALVLPDPEEPVTHVWAEGAERHRRPGPGPGVRRCDPPDAAVAAIGWAAALTRGLRPWRHRSEPPRPPVRKRYSPSLHPVGSEA